MTNDGLYIITGQSGSGKTTAIGALEDIGIYCVDNIPVTLIPPLIDAVKQSDKTGPLGIGLDMRTPDYFEKLHQVIDDLKDSNIPIKLIFLETTESALIQRYSEVRRPHPLERGQGLEDAIGQERLALASVRALADEVVNTTKLTSHMLRKTIQRLHGEGQELRMQISILSFGFKHGLPASADLVFDVRFLPNPHYIAELRPLTGLNAQVKNYVMQHSSASEFVSQCATMLQTLLPQYQREGKAYLTVALGCTGGQHRSVSVARALAESLHEAGISVDVRHREIREVSQ